MNRKLIVSLLLSGAALLLSGSLLVQGLALKKDAGEAQVQGKNMGIEKDAGSIVGAQSELLPEAGEEAPEPGAGLEQEEAAPEQEPGDAAPEPGAVFGQGFQKDTSEGTYRMNYVGVERDGWLYYSDIEGNCRVFRQKVDGSGQKETFIDEEMEETNTGWKILATEQYFYLFGRGKVNQYTLEGQKLGSLELANWYGVWDHGYFYYTSDWDTDGYRLYRMKAETGSQPELLSEEEIFDFRICNGTLYYTAEEDGKDQLISMGLDGSSRTVIGETGELGYNIGRNTNVLYKESVYGWKGYGVPALYRIGLDGSEELMLSGSEYIADYNFDGSTVTAGSWAYFETSEKVTDIDYETSHGVYNLDTGEKVLFQEEWFSGEKKTLSNDQWVGPFDDICPINIQNATRIYFQDYHRETKTYTIFSIGTDGADRIECAEAL